MPDEQYEQLKQCAVSKSLAVLLESCRVYPPALAKAALHVNALEGCSRDEFIKTLERQIREAFEQQHNQPYLLVRSRVNELGYRDAGEYVWVIAYSDQKVTWVSSDYQIYSDAVSTFEVEPTWLERRFNQRTV